MLKTISPIDESVYVKREYANTNEIENTFIYRYIKPIFFGK